MNDDFRQLVIAKVGFSPVWYPCQRCFQNREIHNTVIDRKPNAPFKRVSRCRKEGHREHVEVHPAIWSRESVNKPIVRDRRVIVLSELHIHDDVRRQHYKSVISDAEPWINPRRCRCIQCHKRCRRATWVRLSWLRERIKAETGQLRIIRMFIYADLHLSWFFARSRNAGRGSEISVIGGWAG
jgi:hypothetical protein